MGHSTADRCLPADLRFRPAHWIREISRILNRRHVSGSGIGSDGWAAARHLGKQWRFEAALNEDHELVQTGPYRWIRHPIYASMLGMLLATGCAWTWWPMQIAGLVFFLIGTEIRVRAEDRLLSERFRESFAAYRARVPAYIPFIR